MTPPPIETVSEYLDSEYWMIFLIPLPTSVIGKKGQNYRRLQKNGPLVAS